MRAMAVLPGKPNSIHLAELPKPSVHEIPNGRVCWYECCASASMVRIKKSKRRLAKLRQVMTFS